MIKIEAEDIKEFIKKYYLLLLVLIMFIASTFMHGAFLTEQNIKNMLGANGAVAIVSIGMFFVILTGGIDLSVGSVIALSGSLTAGLLNVGVPWSLTIIIVLMLMAIPGLISGLLVTVGKITPIMVTLAMMIIIRGIAYIYQTGSPSLIRSFPIVFMGQGDLLQIPMPLILLVVITIPSYFFLHKTSMGRKIYAIGGNKKAALLSGIRVNRYIVLTYVLSSVLAGLAGIILAGRIMMGSAIVGEGYELNAIAAVVIGGAALDGGSGFVLNVILGAFVMGIVSNILNLIGVSTYFQMMISGLIIVGAVFAARKMSDE